MRIGIYFSTALLGVVALLGTLAARTSTVPGNSSVRSRPPELEYLKAINKVAPPQDPQLLFLLMGAVLEREFAR
jgi:hypothetical protein